MLARTASFLSVQLDEGDLGREFVNPTFRQVPTVGQRLNGVLNEGFQHTGLIAMLRGVLQETGWPRWVPSGDPRVGWGKR